MCLWKVAFSKFLSTDSFSITISVTLLNTEREFECLAHHIPTHFVYYVPIILPLLQVSPSSTQLVTSSIFQQYVFPYLMLWYLTVHTSDLKKWEGRRLGLLTKAL
jgi:hypothetical protein